MTLFYRQGALVRLGSVALMMVALAVLPNPAHGQVTASDIDRLVSQSDDYQTWGAEFRTIAMELLASGRCEEGDFVEMGGFWRSAEVAGRYFIYCGTLHRNNRIDVFPGDYR